MLAADNSNPVRYEFDDTPEMGDTMDIAPGVAWLRMHLLWVMQLESVRHVADQVARYCGYERRRKRKNYIELCQ